MYVNSGYLNNSRAPIKDKSRPLIVTSCGTYRLKNTKKCPLGDQRGDSTINCCMFFREKRTFSLTERNGS